MEFVHVFAVGLCELTWFNHEQRNGFGTARNDGFSVKQWYVHQQSDVKDQQLGFNSTTKTNWDG